MEKSSPLFRAAALAATVSFSLFSLSPSAEARVPPPGTPAADKLNQYGEAIRNMQQPANGISCCNVSDCRDVNVRNNAKGKLEAFIGAYDSKTGEGFDNGPNKWLEVPERVIVPAEKRPEIPFAIACWSVTKYEPYSERGDRPEPIDNGFYCFTPPLLVRNDLSYRVTPMVA